MPNAYEVSICNEDLTTSIFYITRPATKSMRGLNRQHNNVVNQVVNAIREVRGSVSYTHLTLPTSFEV